MEAQRLRVVQKGGQTRLGHLLGDPGYLEVEERAWREESCGLTLL